MNMSIRNKLILFLLAATILPIATSIVMSYWYTNQSITEKSIRENSRLLTLGKTNLQNYLTSINQLALSIYSGINSPTSLYTTLEEAKPADNPDENAEFYSSRDSIYIQLYNMYQSNVDFHQIHLFVLANQQSNLLVKGLFRREKNEDFTSPLSPSGEARPFVEPTHKDYPYGMNFSVPNLKTGSTNVFTFHHPIYKAPSKEVLAYLSIDVKLKELENIVRRLHDPVSEQIFILDQDNRIVFSSDSSQLGKELNQGWANRVHGEAENGHFSWDEDSFGGIILYDRIREPYVDWSIVKLIPNETLYRDTNAITRMNTIIGAIFLSLAVAATILISFQFTRPIKNLIAYANKVQTGNLEANFEVRGNDEISLLARKIRSMMETINNLILREYRLELANKTNQLKALQAQVNPHFLYNALQSIATLALHHQAPKIYSLIQALGKMMRYNMTTDQTEVPLYREFENVQAYLDLQKERFGERLAFELRMGEQTREITVPKMILQPIVENYFKHGFEGGSSTGNISVGSRIDELGRLEIEIADNGKGITPERLESLHEVLSRKVKGPDDGQIGLQNVLSRLQLYFGLQTEMIIAPIEPTGVSIMLLISLSDHAEEGRNVQ